MKTWLRMLTVVVTVGGGFLGFALTTQVVATVAKSRADVVVCLLFAALYAYVLTAGLLFVHNPRRLLPVIAAVSMQVPFVSSPLLSYRFTSGLHCTVGIVGANIAAAARLGSDFAVTVLRPQPWGAGVNLFALGLLIALVRARWRDTEPPLPPPGLAP